MWRCWCEDKNWLWPDEGGCQSLIERDRKDSWVRCRVRCYSQTKTTHKPGRVVSGQHIRSGVRIVQKRGWIMSRTAHQIVDDVTVGKQGNGSKHFSLEVEKGKIAMICMRSSTKTYYMTWNNLNFTLYLYDSHHFESRHWLQRSFLSRFHLCYIALQFRLACSITAPFIHQLQINPSIIHSIHTSRWR